MRNAAGSERDAAGGNTVKRLHIEITGIVQGVGFRPFVYSLAQRHDIAGFVTNTSRGVIIEAEGADADAFASAVKTEYPPLAKINSVVVHEMSVIGESAFVITKSIDEGSFTHISPDVAVCADCLHEMFDPEDRRYHYPFINCTNCGPRYTITKKVPYDRPNTTMADFTLCEACSAEYNDPLNRRFHAQPNACPACGPQVSFEIGSSGIGQACGNGPIASVKAVILSGGIVAVKGLGGFHLCCDATNPKAVEELRQRKRRKNKPFGLMAGTLGAIRQHCRVSEAEASLLTDRRRPIVLLKKLPESTLPPALAPNNTTLGFMLPYTPIHYLLFAASDGSFNEFPALVMTSANLSEEPIVIGNDEARERLSGIADAFLVHNREIFMRVDDSVVRVVNGKQRFIRRARGYAPEAIDLGADAPDLLATGAEVKNTFALSKGRFAIVSQHIGDMENYETLRFFEETLRNLKQVYRAEPEAVAHDLHPGYLATQWSQRQCEERNLKCLGVQHHHAHIAAVMAEHQILEPIIGVALDGTGYGPDGTIWGGEFLICRPGGFERRAHFDYFPLPGGEMAIRQPWRLAVSLLQKVFGDGQELLSALQNIGFIEKYGEQKLEQIIKIARTEQFSPISCGAGRYFDAVSALAGVCDVNTFEGEAAIALESCIPEGAAFSAKSHYQVALTGEFPRRLDFSRLTAAIVEDISRGVATAEIALLFHNAVIDGVLRTVDVLSQETGLKIVALSGGVFQNAYLSEQLEKALSDAGFVVALNEQLPCNDACMSLGQLSVMQEMLQK
ncbi:MAG: hydrogenase maturation protein HypF [Nitrospirae bacterium]|nr:MAG: hydrogenase maturation protein HypF [Nitrospirota bacterium]